MRWGLSGRWLLAGVVLLVNLPFLAQPFHIDDRIYLEVADNILQRPLFPYDYAPVFEGLITPDAASHSHLPLISYYLAALKTLAGGHQEWFYHLLFLPFPLIAAFSFRRLADRYTRYSLAASLLLVLSAGVLVLSHTLMTELPLLAFWLLAVERFLKIADGQGSVADWLGLAAALTAASLISLISGGLLLLLGAYWVSRRMETGEQAKDRPPVSGRLLLLLLLPLALWVAWYLRGYLHYDRLLLVRTFLHMEKRAAFDLTAFGWKGLSMLLNLGGAFLCPPAVWYGFGRYKSLWGLVLVAAAPGLGFWVAGEGWGGTPAFLWALMLVAGVLALLGIALEAGKMLGGAGPRSDWLLLLLWFAGIAVSAILLYPSGSVRYLLLLAPPLILFWLAALERKVPENPYFLRNLVWMGVILTALYSLPLAVADYRLAAMYRRDAAQLVEQYDDRRVWFTGEWGLRYYLQQEGAAILPRTATGPQAGDVIIKPYVALPWVTLYDGPEYSRLLVQQPASTSFPVRILDFRSHAGFYSTAWGILPWSWAREGPWEWYNVYEVLKEYDGPIPEPEKHW